MSIEPLEIIKKYYKPKSKSYKILVVHSEMVAQKALQVAEKVKHLNPDFKFVEEAAMLHDIGIFMTDQPDIGCYGQAPYIAHGTLGRIILEKEGLPKHALVCERHTGVGLTRKEIIGQNLPIPVKDMLPISLEEKIVCFADLFYGKNPGKLREEKTLDKIARKIAKYGPENEKRFADLLNLYGF
jgi:uncharacterized protein